MASQSITIGAESISGSLQGVEIKTFDQVYQGMMPKIRPLNRNVLIVGDRRIDNLKMFDESLSTDISTEKTEEFPNFEMENLSFGVSKDFKDNTAFEDTMRFDPVSYLLDTYRELIYPQVLFNASANDTDGYNGAIEPLTIVAKASRNSIESPWFAHDVRGAVSNAAEDVRRRCNPIVDFVFPVDTSVEAYLDECFDEDMLGLPQPPFFSEPSDISPPFADGTDWEDAAGQLAGDITSALLQSRESTEQMFPRGSVSARCGQFVSLQESPGTDSITYAGMKR
jgi:hypothetical protein